MHAHPFENESAVQQVERESECERERDVWRERERCVCVCVFFLNFFSLFYSGNSSTYLKFRIVLCKKSDRTRCLAVSILE